MSLPKIRHLSRPAWAVIIAIVFFIIFFGTCTWFRQINLFTAQFDMGNMDQTLWQSIHGRWFQMAGPLHPVLQVRTAAHADFLLLIYLPFYWLIADPRTLMILQVIAVASGALPLFWLARKKLGDRLGAFLTIMYLLYPTLGWATLFDVHAVVLAAPLFLWIWWAATYKRWWAYYPLIALAVLAKEEVGLVVAAVGLYWIWRRGYRWMGIISIALGVGWTILMLNWAIPAARGVAGHFALSYYAQYGDSVNGIFSNLLTHPWRAIWPFINPANYSLYRVLLMPVGGMAIFGLPVLILALPEFAVNLLSSNVNQQTIYFQYMSVITPFIFLGAIDGWPRLWRWLNKLPTWLQRLKPRLLINTVVIASAIFAIYWWAPLPATRHHTDAIRIFSASPYRADVKRVQHDLRPNDKVVATNNLVPQFSRRDLIWGFPNDLDQADAIVVLEGGDYEPLPALQISAAVRELEMNTNFTLIFRDGLFWYFRKVSG